MDPISNIPGIGSGLPILPTINTGTINIRSPGITGVVVKDIKISDTRIWMQTPPQAIPIEPPVVVRAGTPIVNMPGCVVVNKENAKNPSSINNNLVNDDPKQNVAICDAGMPYYQPPDYQANELTWRTVYMEPEEQEGGVKTDPPEDVEAPTPEAPVTPPTKEVEECPSPNARRIGDLSQSGKEKVSGYEWNSTKTECITLWEDVPWTQEFFPDPGIVTTTATIAAVATTSALLAKPLADLLLKVVKPTVKKVIAKVKKILGKKEKVLSKKERLLAQRERNRAVMALRKAVKK
ncbi:MAG TPA: hypothetical protein QF621_07500 [Candidatus Thalassarchaeaceae archaeon]|nr:hypothetical protein [Candidatus Thalassarchaeaceae archaeon]|tara:strand:- start:945 stop:1823 length:879 start_codon:yes stop_codon:yes gene_type:complete